MKMPCVARILILLLGLSLALAACGDNSYTNLPLVSNQLSQITIWAGNADYAEFTYYPAGMGKLSRYQGSNSIEQQFSYDPAYFMAIAELAAQLDLFDRSAPTVDLNRAGSQSYYYHLTLSSNDGRQFSYYALKELCPGYYCYRQNPLGDFAPLTARILELLNLQF